MIKDLTEGNPQKVLWRFTIPMFISVIFQQLYNIADSVIAGKFAGEDALAAVGASYPITMIFMAIAVGSNVGCAVVISQLFGAKEYGKMKTAVYTTLLSSFVLAVVLTVGGLLGTQSLMRMIRTPDNIFSDGALYLRIYVGGLIFLFLYNVATGIFTALGDSKTPLYFLIGSSLGYMVCGRFPLGRGRRGLGDLHCPGYCLHSGPFNAGSTASSGGDKGSICPVFVVDAEKNQSDRSAEHFAAKLCVGRKYFYPKSGQFLRFLCHCRIFGGD